METEQKRRIAHAGLEATAQEIDDPLYFMVGLIPPGDTWSCSPPL
jgi:hypothetical protein